MRPRIVILPEYRPGHGLGHLSRALTLASGLGGRAAVHIPPEAGQERLEAIRALAASRGADHLLTPDGTAAADALFVLDRRRISRDEVARLRHRGFVIGIDAAGPGRVLCDYLIDILPRVDRVPANVRDMRLLDLSPRSSRGRGARVLVTLGGDDPSALTGRVVDALLYEGLVDTADLDVLLPQLAGGGAVGGGHAGVRYLTGPVDLAGRLGEYHTVVTSFGLTALEAAWAGCRVVLVNAGRYHARLARRAGFRSATAGGVGKLRLRRGIRRRFADGGGAEVVRRTLEGAEEISLSRVVSELSMPGVHDCPACGETEFRTLARFCHRTYVRCPSCTTIYLRSFAPPRSYGEEYFFEEYRNQYGRTYLEDAAHIREMGRSRLKLIAAALRRRGSSRVSTGRGVRLLDLGCAYGPFLEAAAEAGYAPAGIDVSEAAVSYVRDTLGFAAARGDLEELARTGGLPAGLAPPARAGTEAGEESPAAAADVVTMWYVIEHVCELSAVLSWVWDLLPPGGVFAFSTPSAAGISARRSLRQFLRQSPDDHLTVWSPRSARRVLRRHGFRLRRIRITGHHPERFPVPGARRNAAVSAVLGHASRLFGLGDTFEVYAVKEGRHG